MYKCYVSFHLFSILSNILGCYPETNVKESKNHTLHLPSAGLCQEHCLEHNQDNNVSFFAIKVWMYLRMYLWINLYSWELFHFNILSYKADFLKSIQRFHSNLTSVYYECSGQLITFHVQWYCKRTYYRGVIFTRMSFNPLVQNSADFFSPCKYIPRVKKYVYSISS